MHWGETGIVVFPSELEDIAEKRLLQYPSLEREYEHDSEGNPNFAYEFQKHCSLGYSSRLQW